MSAHSIRGKTIIGIWITLAALLVLVSIILSLTNPLVQASTFPQRAKEITNGLYVIFYLDAEMSVPNWFSSVGLLGCAILLMLNGLLAYSQTHKFARRWMGLGLLFILLSVDESIGFHERTLTLGRQVIAWLIPGLTLYYAWVVFAPIILLIAAALYWPVFSQLPRSIQVRMAIAAVLYLIGILVIETVSGELLNTMNTSSLLYVGLAHIEETLELAGVILFADALLRYISTQLAGHPFEVMVN